MGDARAIGFGEDGDSVGVDGVLDEGRDWIGGFHFPIPISEQEEQNGHRHNHIQP